MIPIIMLSLLIILGFILSSPILFLASILLFIVLAAIQHNNILPVLTEYKVINDKIEYLKSRMEIIIPDIREQVSLNRKLISDIYATREDTVFLNESVKNFNFTEGISAIRDYNSKLLNYELNKQDCRAKLLEYKQSIVIMPFIGPDLSDIN